MRWLYYFISIASILMVTLIYQFWSPIIYSLIILVPYILIGLWDVFSFKHTILRNYPVIGHFRYFFEYIRPEIQQYFIENDKDGSPYSREIRSLIYQRAKKERDTIAFGTQRDISAIGYQFSYHSLNPKIVAAEKARVMFGGEECKKPYNASRLNISGMSFGALSPNALRAMNKGAKKGNFAHNTGEGGISPYHLEGGGDLIWQIGTGYFGCRKNNGRFDEKIFSEKAKMDVVKMIELKLSQGAKPAHGGVLPAVKVTEEIAKIRLIQQGKDVISPPNHPEFSNPIGLMQFVAKLRKLSGGKPVGFKLCIGKRSEFMGICKAMLETGITPDFITIDGAEGGTGAAPVVYSNRLGTPINEALVFVNNCLVGANLRDKIKVVASGKIATGYDMIVKLAFGADACNVARAMMFAVGCVQSLHCNTNCCPTGVATQNEHRWSSLHVASKYLRVANFHHGTIDAFLELLGAMGKADPSELLPEDIRKYVDVNQSKDYASIYPMLNPGELLSKKKPPEFLTDWQNASANSF
ncbi:MAG: FMN-binding glutamate synthase family protein [Rickettsiaceae bacterium]|nr:FMN-binding glutamate synthase family protein [Rickettsiaceae bacterium]